MRARALLLLGLAGLWSCGDQSGGAGPPTSLVTACIASTACGVRAYPRVSNCLDSYYTLYLRFGLGPAYDAIYRCVTAAQGDCDKVFDCYGTTRAAGRCDTTFQARCESGKAIACDTIAGNTFVLDCGAVGLSCQVKASASFDASCATGACSASSFKTHCEGQRLLSCSDGAIAVEDCAAQGLACGATAVGSPSCTGAGEECAPGQLAPSCEGNVAVSCIAGKVARQDCSARATQRRCEYGACVRSGTECLDEFDRCQGDALQACLDGRWETYDCGALGLGPCQPAKNGAACSVK